MINIIIPMSGKSLYETSADFIYPKILTEVNNRTLLEYSQDIFSSLEEDYKTIFIAPSEKIKNLALDKIIDLVSPSAKLVALQGMTKGAVCSSLMAVDELNLESELIIASADHYLNENLQEVIEYFRGIEADAGLLTFESVHPKWSFVKINSDGLVIQAAEKSAISRNAVAGLYYFKRGSDFVEAAKNLIRKDNSIDDVFYLSSCLNELILKGKKIVTHPLKESVYHNFYDAHAVKAFEVAHQNIVGITNDNSKKSIKEITEQYVSAFDQRSLHDVIDFFDRNATLVDPANHLTGVENIRNMLVNLFSTTQDLKFTAKSILADGNKAIIEFELTIDEKLLRGVDIIEWNSGNKISRLDAYLY
ncbi:nuclear transport factor 2 family protein [Pantoea septica]|uniref:nuclear transport factor 2 family protein n=1 Tax=Pantoea septica TaxID=472695 RepID=UPI0028A17FA0|nr:nuclear transport factor 2 family protein [Pantoea septica]